VKRVVTPLAMLAAWALIAGFGWVYATNAYILERLDADRAREQQRLDRLRAECERLERELTALQADPFFIERLARETLRWACPHETPPGAPLAAGPAAAAAADRVPLAAQSNRAVFATCPDMIPTRDSGSRSIRMADTETPSAESAAMN